MVDIRFSEIYLKKHFSRCEFPLMFTFCDNGYDTVLIVGSLDGVKEMAIDILKRREEYLNVYYHMSMDNKPIEPQLPPNDSPGYIKKAYKTELDTYQSKHKRYLKLKEEREYFEAAMSGDGASAYILLEWRKDEEYESFDFISLRNIKTYK